MEYIMNNMDNKLDVIYAFHLIQKSLPIIRQGYKNSGNFLLTTLELHLNNLIFQEKISEEAFNVVKFPFLAYTPYIENDYVKAEELILKSISSINFTISQGFDEAILALIEQEFNLLKVFFKNKNEEVCINQAYKILQILYTNNSLLKFVSNEEYIDIISFFTNRIIMELYKSSDFDINFNKLVLMLNNIKTTNFQVLKDLFQFYEILSLNTLKLSLNNRFSLDNVPFILQYKFFEKFFKNDKFILDYISNFQEFKTIQKHKKPIFKSYLDPTINHRFKC